jgi:hypothetical protein
MRFLADLLPAKRLIKIIASAQIRYQYSENVII